MVNLLFISSNPKIDHIRNALQPLLKVRIDVVGDFDFGLKEVFEKRPSLVFIQDQIAGVTGESVARHIQMLLGSGAPSFIFMHDGNSKAKPIKGLYDYLVDLSLDNSKVAADIQHTLKSLLGQQWEKIYVRPKENKSVVKPAQVVPEEQRTVADQLVDEFFTDLGGVTQVIDYENQLPDGAKPDSSTEDSCQIISSTSDQLDDILAAAVSELKVTNAVTEKSADLASKRIDVIPVSTVSSDLLMPAEITQHAPAPISNDATVVPDKPASVQPPSPKMVNTASAPPRTDISGKSPSPLISPANFRIEKQRSASDFVSDDSLRSFEAEYLSKTASKKWYQIVFLVLCLVGICWFLIKQKPHLLRSFVKDSSPVIETSPAPQPALQPPASVQTSVSSVHKPETSVLPSFIPLAGVDRTFSSQKPGWERYVGSDSEFRLFRSAGKLKAVQVLASKGSVISDSTLKKVLIELTGTAEYRITSREHKLGFQVSRATISRKADLLIYRKRSSIHAFVISLD